MLSYVTNKRLEDVAEACPSLLKIFNIIPLKDKEVILLPVDKPKIECNFIRKGFNLRHVVCNKIF